MKNKIILIASLLASYLSYADSGVYKLMPYQKHTKNMQLFSDTIMSTAVWPLQLIHADYAHNINQKGQNTRICIIDSGADLTHPALQGAVLEGQNFTGIGSPSDLSDEIGHGTMMATIIAGREIQNYSGVAPEAKLVIAKVIGAAADTSNEKLVRAFKYCMSKSDVINLSLGGTQTSEELSQYMTIARKNGISIVAAAGNTGEDLLFPANSGSAQAIGAVGRNLQVPQFSPESLKLSYVAPGVQVPILTRQLTYEYYSGTSFSAAYTSGAEAIRISALKKYLKSRSLGLPAEKEGKGLIDLELTLNN